MRLVVPLKKGARLYHVRPLREPLAPPEVVFRDRMKLWKVKGDQPRNLKALYLGTAFTTCWTPNIVGNLFVSRRMSLYRIPIGNHFQGLDWS